MAIVEKATTVKDYYRNLKEDYNKKLEDTIKDLAVAEKTNVKTYDELNSCLDFIKREFKINLKSFDEFNSNSYIDGSLLKFAIKFNRNANEDVERRYAIIILRYAQSVENIYNFNHNIEKYKKILSLSYSEYTKYIKTYYYEVQRQMIVNGYAYKFHGSIGTICINRCKNLKRIPIINTKATNANKERLKKEGKELYDEKKAAWCKDHGVEYHGVEYRVFSRHDYLYEFALLWSGLPNPFRHKFEPIDYWGAKLRGKHKEDFIKEANGNLNYICGLDITFRTKITICNEMDETLYLNFIRNENQTPITTSKNHR